jgi:pimeloyl-ACP methyl ester carboxylesterase
MAAELTRRIQGAIYRTMPGLGHFPMSEDPEQFATYVLPILDDIRTHSERRRTRV